MNRLRVPRLNAFDKLVGFVNPRAAIDRLRCRAALSAFSTLDDGTGYAVGGQTVRRSMRGWRPREKSADEATAPILDKARASSRDLYTNTPVATAALRRVRTNVVGPGLTLQARVDRDLLKLTDEQADEWEKITEREWRLWSESKDCDATRTQNFPGLQRLAFLSALMNGDAFALLPFAPEDRPRTIPYKTTVQLVEADRVASPPALALQEALPVPGKDPKVVAGVEVDEFGAPVAYWIKKIKSTIHLLTRDDYIRIDAFGEKSGRRNVLHLVEVERIGQRRGMPYLANVIDPLKQVTRLSEAELMAAVIASFFTVFVKSTTGPGALAGAYTEGEALTAEPDGTTGRDATNPDNNVYEVGSGNVVELGEDQSIELADPKRPNDAFDPFFTAIVRQIGAALEQPYEVLMQSFTSSYSASRAALLEAWKFYRERRAWLSANFCQPVYEEWLVEAISLGRISARGFFDDAALRKAWTGSAWSGPGQGQIDPVKETRGSLLKVGGNLSTYEDEFVGIHGGDWDGAMARRGRENRKLAAEKLPTEVQTGSGGGR